MNKKLRPVWIFLLTIVLMDFSCNAQFSGLSSFSDDTLIRKKLVTHHVRAVTETLKDSTVHLNGRYTFDRNGLVTDAIFARGRGFDRLRYYYNERGHLVKGEGFPYNDTVHVDNWKIWTLDAKGRTLKEVSGRIVDGQTTERTTFECTYLIDKPGKTQMVVQRHDDYKAQVTVRGRDSIAGVDTFFVSYEYTGNPVRIAHKKELVLLHKVGDYMYRNVVSYDVYNGKETARDITGTYYLYDKKGRLTEYGTVSYKEMYTDFMQDHPDEFRPGYFAPVFVAAVLSGTVQGQRRAEFQKHFDDDGRMIGMTEGEFEYTFKYNSSGQMVEQTTTGETYGKAVQRQTYDSQGLIIKAVLNYKDLNGKSTYTESTFKYFYY